MKWPSSLASIDGSSSELRYTSLKDILQLDSPTYRSSNASGTAIHGGGGGGHASIHEVYAFNSSTIGIRNQLVKHAASAYLQSAAILATRNQNCLTRLWRRLQPRHVSASWQGCMRDPFEVCVGFVARSVRRALACIAGYVGGVRAWAGWTSIP
ncbi:putative E3 ubiquitin-protein ligase arkadia-A [Cocos nucifera]|uniref:Putative E3 ubiquitin-protein ligase arkadia-A n=1 Tax=Cocos nucifera TaxID=13894 RepID=A0A8K0IE18_COCNU|nr:putative E3 ubiquitin-protein ligase arkadia-A [Cocos nucifera]